MPGCRARRSPFVRSARAAFCYEKQQTSVDSNITDRNSAPVIVPFHSDVVCQWCYCGGFLLKSVGLVGTYRRRWTPSRCDLGISLRYLLLHRLIVVRNSFYDPRELNR